MCAAIRSTSTAGRRRARKAGATGTCCPTSAAPRAFAAAPTTIAATNGPLATARAKRNPLYDAFIEAGRQAGYAVSGDFNGERQEGFGALDMTVKDGVRWSAANAYLRPAMKRRNLKVVTHAHATRIVFDGRRAVGVGYRRGGRKHEVARAARGDPLRRGDQFAATA